jgi:hypothetical protein
MTETKLNLRQKLASIYTAVGHIDKYGTNQKQHYNYVRAADVLHAIRKAFAEVGIYAQTNYTLLGTYDIKTNAGGVMHTATVRVEIVLMDTESDETVTISGVGDGADSGDKGIYKAMTGATKCALRNGFLVPDEADPEADAAVDAATSGQYEEPAPLPTRAPRQEVARPTYPMASNDDSAPELPPASEIPAEFDDVSTAEPAPAPRRKRGEPIPGPEMPAAGGELPEPTELESFRARHIKFGNDLTTAGLKASRGMPVNRKTLAYLLHITGQVDAMKITKAQWEVYLGFIDKMSAMEDGMSQLVKLVQDIATKG